MTSHLMKKPHSYPRRILVAVSGLSPATLSESLYALAVKSQPAFIPTEIHLITTQEGKTRAVNTLIKGDKAALHVSIAGGRKTMGYYIGYALSLYGRTQDRLSHVLVDAEFESCFEFRYPTRQTQIISGQDGKPLDSSEANVYLANIPFVRMRDLMNERTIREIKPYSPLW